MRSLAIRVLTALLSIVLTVVAAEIFLPLFVEITDDIRYEHLPGVGIRLKPGQEGVYIRETGDGGKVIRARFRSNNVGFNNASDYHQPRKEGVLRIAVVGDSFVEAFHVELDEALHSVMEKALRRQGIETEVLSFGVSGFGTAQVYKLLEEQVLNYRPDRVFYLFIANDVADSSPFQGRSFGTQQYELDGEGNLRPLPFSTYQLSAFRSSLKWSRLFRYLYYQKRWSERLRSTASGRDGPEPVGDDLADQEVQAWAVVEKLLLRIDLLLQEQDVNWTLVWQGDADPDYHADTERRLREISTRHQIHFLDLSSDLARDFNRRGEPARISGDGHWNRHGHRVAGTAMARVVISELSDVSAIRDP